MACRSGIYCIINLTNFKRYVGSSVNARKRIARHKWLLRRGEHESPLLQAAWDRDGEASFLFGIIEHCEVSELLEREQLWINVLCTAGRRSGYNVSAIAGTRAGVPQPESSRQKSRERFLGKPKSSEHKEKIRQSALARWADPTERDCHSKRNLGKPKTDRRKLSDAEVAALRQARMDGATYAELQRRFRRSQDSIHKILHGLTYRGVVS
jgi:group I intron endonuclease